MQPLPLRSVRPFAIKEVVLKDYDGSYNLHDDAGLMQLFEDLVNELLAGLRPHTARPLSAREEQLQRYPLVRLKIDYTGYSTCNPQRFGQRFIDKARCGGGRLTRSNF